MSGNASSVTLGYGYVDRAVRDVHQSDSWLARRVQVDRDRFDASAIDATLDATLCMVLMVVIART
jgi:hypothetical protein